ncbi:formylglycine-generating enzyme family protein [Ruminiclostridium papyrosolvens]|uniref:Transcriptional regulator n=1 Tax=Ruminiclostridium papyrosolvens C7 TaxID=1330534 RepID=U4R422_9FIRM|nr:formylglycine-generating enzyme family protein [Ruminiclostridium papyrosolvens]EPR13254.1 transcriptional regulator [Ruminiclostridium papyrosolvens C7]
MKKLLIFLLITMMVGVSACSQEKPSAQENLNKKEVSDNLVLVKGGISKNKKSNLYEKNVEISDFYIGKYEVTQIEWNEIMESNPSQYKGDNLPVEMVNWYECIEYCNKRSIKEGLDPYYNIDKDKKDPNNTSEIDDIKWTVTINSKANGYRLPTEVEWEYAASGGQDSKNYTYSGSNNVDEVAWYWVNSGNKKLDGEWYWPKIESNKNQTKAVGSKKSNELGLYDMSSNVREWCWNWYGDALDSKGGSLRVWRGGCWLSDDRACEFSYRGKFDPNGKGYDQGFRVCRNK